MSTSVPVAPPLSLGQRPAMSSAAPAAMAPRQEVKANNPNAMNDKVAKITTMMSRETSIMVGIFCVAIIVIVAFFVIASKCGDAIKSVLMYSSIAAVVVVFGLAVVSGGNWYAHYKEKKAAKKAAQQ